MDFAVVHRCLIAVTDKWAKCAFPGVAGGVSTYIYIYTLDLYACMQSADGAEESIIRQLLLLAADLRPGPGRRNGAAYGDAPRTQIQGFERDSGAYCRGLYIVTNTVVPYS